MEIRDYVVGETLKMHLVGRLDAYWSERVAGQIESAIRHGHKHIRLNLAELHYLSSAGVQTLVHYSQELARLQGSLLVASPSDSVRNVLSLSGLDALIAAPGAAAGEAELSTREVGGARFEVSSTTAAPRLQCQVVRIGADRQASCGKDSLIVGVGAIAGGAASTQCGPLFALGGAALCLPPDTHRTPDYVLSATSFTPEVVLQSGIVCDGGLTLRASFGADLTIGELAAAALEILGSDAAAFAVLGNSASGEPVMAAGVALRTPARSIGAFLQPLTHAQWPAGSLVGAVFSGGPVAAFDGEVASAVDGFFKDRFGSRVPQRIISGQEAIDACLAEGCFFAGVISGVA
jgi:anti-anti-sigma factor